MAKRRNPKKEKANRNKLYARQFRNKTSRFSSRRKGGFGQDKKQGQGMDAEANKGANDLE